jgi:3-oxosteroid 1-dehydrogenase
VRAETPSGESVECHGSVVLATSGFDHDAQLVKKHWGLEDYASMAPSTLEGDGIRLAQSAGAAILHVPGRYAPIVPGYRTDTVGSGYAFAQEHSLPHTFIVDSTASRFADDASYWVLVHAALDPEDQHVPLYMVWDEQHHQRYGLGQTPPGGEYPADLVSSASTLRELGELLGLDGETLERTAATFNEHAARGEDPDFGRGTKYTWQVFGGDPSHPIHPNTAPVEQSPFYGIPLVLGGTGVGMTGVKVDSEGRAVGEDGGIVPGLFAVGSAAAFTSSGSGYNSGMALSRAVTFGYIVAEQLVAQAARVEDRVAG